MLRAPETLALPLSRASIFVPVDNVAVVTVDVFRRSTAAVGGETQLVASGAFDFRSVLRKTNLLDVNNDQPHPASDIQQVDFRSVLRRKAII